MILLIDVGNTRIKWRHLEQDTLSGGGQQVHHGHLSPEVLHQMWGARKPVTIWGVNVAGAHITDEISRYAKSQWGLIPNFVTASKSLGDVTNGYNEPEKLGADRWMAMVGAARIVHGGCCVADCGSAVTVDCMNPDQEHIGGLILPGLNMMSKCVSENTAQVSLDAGEAGLLGRDTASCLLSGATQSIVGTLLRMADLMDRRFSSPVSRIITGGDAPQLLPWLGEEWRFEPDLIFLGLAAEIQHYQGK